MLESWREFALFFHQPQTSLHDPIFGKPLSFYLFSLPVYEALSSWLLYLTLIVLVAAIVYALLAATQQATGTPVKDSKARRSGLMIVSAALAAFLLALAWSVLLSRIQ